MEKKNLYIDVIRIDNTVAIIVRFHAIPRRSCDRRSVDYSSSVRTPSSEYFESAPVQTGRSPISLEVNARSLPLAEREIIVKDTSNGTHHEAVRDDRQFPEKRLQSLLDGSEIF